VNPNFARSFHRRPPPLIPRRSPPTKKKKYWLPQIWRSPIAMKLLEEPQQPPDADAKMKMTMNEHRPGTCPELH
jgi:hypothetical protein